MVVWQQVDCLTLATNSTMIAMPQVKWMMSQGCIQNMCYQGYHNDNATYIVKGNKPIMASEG